MHSSSLQPGVAGIFTWKGVRDDQVDLPVVPTAAHVDAKPLEDQCALTAFSLDVRNIVNVRIGMSIALFCRTVKVGEEKTYRAALRL
jgi:hypothetical protein